MRVYHLASYKNGKQNFLRFRRLVTEEGELINNIAGYGILHYPSNPHCDVGTFYCFAPWYKQDKLEDGLLRIDVKVNSTQHVAHYLSIDSLEEIVGPSFINLNIVIFAPWWLGSLINRIYSTITNYKH